MLAVAAVGPRTWKDVIFWKGLAGENGCWRGAAPDAEGEGGGREQGRRNCKNHFGREINED